MLGVKLKEVKNIHQKQYGSTTVYCQSCGTLHERGCDGAVAISTGGGTIYLCKNCVSKNTVKCAICGQLLYKRRAYISDGESYCDACKVNTLKRCARCGTYHNASKMVKAVNDNGDAILVCKNCGLTGFHCNICGKLYVSPNDSYINESFLRGACKKCAEKNGYIAYINGYHQGQWHDCSRFNSFKWVGAQASTIRPQGLGFELELNPSLTVPSHSNRNVPQLARDLYDNGFTFIKSFEEDSSLENRGVELVSNPITFTQFSKIDWSNFFAIIKKHGFMCDSHTGLHLTYDRYLIGRTTQTDEREQRNTYAKLVYFIAKNYDDLFILAGRGKYAQRGAQSRYAKRPNIDNPDSSYNCITRDVSRTWAQQHTSINFIRGYRYYALSGEKYDSRNSGKRFIEWRLGAGTLEAEEFIAWVDFSSSIIKIASRISWADIDNIPLWLQLVDESTIEYYKNKYINDDAVLRFLGV